MKYIIILLIIISIFITGCDVQKPDILVDDVICHNIFNSRGVIIINECDNGNSYSNPKVYKILSNHKIIYL